MGSHGGKREGAGRKPDKIKAALADLVPDVIALVESLLRDSTAKAPDRLRAAELVAKYSLAPPEQKVSIDASVKLYQVVKGPDGRDVDPTAVV